MIEYIKTNNAPSAIGPYSQGVIINDLIYASGQIAINPTDGSLNNKDIQEYDILSTNLSSSEALEFKDVVKYDEGLFIWL